MKVAVLKPQGTPEIVEIDGSLESFQKLVDGFIEVLYLNPDLIVVINEEGRIEERDPSLVLPDGRVLVGNITICTSDDKEGEMLGLNDEQQKVALAFLNRYRIN